MEIEFNEEEFLALVNGINPIKNQEIPVVQKKEANEVKVGITYVDFIESFKHYFPKINLIKSPEDVLNYDLIIVPGGEDVNPALYNEENRYSYVNDYRDSKEIPIVKSAIKNRKKIYAVCRGHQLINVLHGGNLYQDLIDDVGYNHPGNHPLENIVDDTIKKYFGNKNVISTHHQAVKSTTLRVTSYFNNIIESCMNKYIISTQFHPEFEDGNEAFFNHLINWATY